MRVTKKLFEFSLEVLGLLLMSAGQLQRDGRSVDPLLLLPPLRKVMFKLQRVEQLRESCLSLLQR